MELWFGVTRSSPSFTLVWMVQSSKKDNVPRVVFVLTVLSSENGPEFYTGEATGTNTGSDGS